MSRRLAALPLALLASVALAADGDAARRAALERAQRLVADALAALQAEDGGAAADILAEARTAAPGEPVVAFDHGRDAYRAALRSGDPGTEAAARSRHNLSLSHLEAARAVATLLRSPGALEDAVRAQGSPGGEPLTPATVTMLASQLRSQALGDGLKNAGAALEILRDSVRRDPSDTDSVRNLVLAQRVRRELEEERRQQQQNDRQDTGDQNAGDEQQDDQQQGRGDEGEEQEQGEDQEQRPSGGEEDEQQGEQQSGEDGESTDDSESSSPPREGEPRDVGREEAERMLEQLLDAAGLKARQVEQMRARRLRRGAVEKDW
jgi:hypothetical protein